MVAGGYRKIDPLRALHRQQDAVMSNLPPIADVALLEHSLQRTLRLQSLTFFFF